jgi:WD40 repeat protein
MHEVLPAPITGIDFDTYGHRLAVTSANGELSVFSTANGLIGKISLNGLHLSCVSYSSQKFGPLIAVGCLDGAVHVFQEGQVIQSFSKKATVLSVAFHPAQCSLAVASLDGSFSVYTGTGNEWKSVTILVTPLGLSAVAWGADSDMLQTLIVGNIVGVVRTYKNAGAGWEVSCGKEVHDGWIRAISAPNGLSGGFQRIATCGDDQRAAVLKLMNSVIEVEYVDGAEAVQDVGWARVDKTLVLAHTDGTVTLWDEDEKGKWVKSLEKSFQS